MMIQAGERFGNYEVETSPDGSPLVLGSGAGGITYRARHVHLGTAVAIKVLLRRKNLRQSDRDAFLSEARAAASLTHPQIARILDFGESASQHPYYVMEICEGGSLEDYVRRVGRPGGDACVQWLFESASALAHAHRNGILHRDIKPSNLLVSHENDAAVVKLIDFGLADRADPGEESAQVIGTPHFAAPEQLRGDARPASDVFSLGASFLWLMTGRNLSHGDVKAVIAERLESTGYDSLLADLPVSWQSLLGRMLAPDPARRPQDGGEVITAIREVFPRHPFQAVAWPDDAAAEGGTSPAIATSRWTEFPDDTWHQHWREISPPSAVEHGELVRATRPGGADVHDVMRFTNLEEDPARMLVTQAGLIASHAPELGLGEVILERGPGWYSVAWPVLRGDDALSWVRRGHACTTAEILGALDPIARALDGIKNGGFDAMELHPAMFFVDPGPPLRFSLALPLPVISSNEESTGSASTMRGALGAGLGARFASCVYQFLSGRTPAPAAFVNPRAYQAIPKLSERSNRFLATAIAGGDAGATCRDVVHGLAHEERIPGASMSGGAAVTASQSTRVDPSRSSQAIPPAPARSQAPAVPPRQAHADPVAEASASNHAPPPLQSDPAAPAPMPAARRKPKVALIAVAAALPLALGIGIAVWIALKWRGGQSSPAPETPVAVVESIPETPAAPAATPAKTPPATPARLAVVNVPGDAATLEEALRRCEDGGAIVLAGGTYTQPVEILKSVSIDGRGSAVLEDSGSGTSLLAIRGKVQVSISNIQIKRATSDTSVAADSAPALVLVSGGASVSFDGCVIEGSLGTGLTIVDKSSATLSNCRIRNNRSSGISLSGGARAEVSLSEIQRNGASGMIATNHGTEVILHRGTNVSANSRNGIEIGNGAALDASGSELRDNQQTGLIIEGGGSVARLKLSCVASGNKRFGIGVRNSGKLVLSEAIVENNSENGVFVEDGGHAELISCRITANGTIGVYLVGGAESKVSISDSTIQSHAEVGVVFIGGTGLASGNRFEKNPIAIYFGKGSRGSATSNSFTEGPIHDRILVETEETINQQDNSIVSGP